MNSKENLPQIVKQTLSLAETIQSSANELRSSSDLEIQNRMVSFITDPGEKVLFTEMVDQGLRPLKKSKIAERMSYFMKNGLPGFFSHGERFLAYLFRIVGKLFSAISVPILMKKVQGETSSLILRGEDKYILQHIRQRKKEQVLLNINHLGEAVLGEREARTRLNEYLADLQKPDIEYISVKATAILSQLQPIAFDSSVTVLKDRLMTLYRKAGMNNKFVNLDMEDYKYLDITITAFMRALEHPDLLNHGAGIALQAYLPDSYQWQIKLTEWAIKRVRAGGSPIKIRLVKGACLETERFESALKDWPLPIYNRKLEVDANYKRMLEYGIKSEHCPAVRIGVASHNIFELAYALVLAKKHGVTCDITIEMLEGMADHVRRALCSINDSNGTKEKLNMLLYAPIVEKKNFINAMAYLVRRMDENTSSENFLSHSFNLTVGSGEWKFLQQQFIDSYLQKDTISSASFRTQDRNIEDYPPAGTFHTDSFSNEPDTDWSLRQNIEWAKEIRNKWMKGQGDAPIQIPLVIAGREFFENREILESFDPSRISEKILVSRCALGTTEDTERAIAVAKEDPDHWRDCSREERHRIISQIAQELRKSRGDIIGAAAANTGKVFTETDPEISEAIDFAEYYPHSLKILDTLPGIEYRGKGVGLVIPPWNFPAAIPAGGMIAALAAGNTLIVKPSSESVLVAWILCQCFWKAGVSGNTLQFLPCKGSTTGSVLAQHPDIDFIIFTGGTDTALQIIRNRPDLYIAAETGGKNATIVTIMADYDQAINNIIHSAFSNGGQKCSATSLVILEKDLFNNDNFRKQLEDAVRTFQAGSAWDFKNRMGPLCQVPDGNLKIAMAQLEPGESWLVKPENIDGNPYLWSPSVKWNVKKGGHCHMNELFGPLISVMPAKNLAQAIDIVNSTGYGLTSGLESLDEREHEVWKAGIRAGNLYINRGTTGAVVQRQPFGGMGKSAYGCGIKAGGPNYTFQFLKITGTGPPSQGAISGEYQILEMAKIFKRRLDDRDFNEVRVDLEKAIEAVYSYIYNYEKEFSQEKDYCNLRGQDNIFRYVPLGTVVVRLHNDDTLFSILARIAGVRAARCTLIVSVPPDVDNQGFIFLKRNRDWIRQGTLVEQTDDELIETIPHVDLIRYSAPEFVPEKVYRAAAETGFYISRTVPISEGRIELLQYFQEQSISHNYHRYGNLGRRGLDSC